MEGAVTRSFRRLLGLEERHRDKWRRPVANQVGKRYQCNQCNTEMIVTKGGNGELQCCGTPMHQK